MLSFPSPKTDADGPNCIRRVFSASTRDSPAPLTSTIRTDAVHRTLLEGMVRRCMQWDGTTQTPAAYYARVTMWASFIV